MTTMKIKVTPEMRIQLMHAETIEIDVPDTQAEFVGHLRQQLLTQDGRCTADPFFVVYSKRSVVADEEYDHDRIVWCREDDSEVEATASQHRRLEALHRNYREPKGWRRLAIKEIDHFETACFTEQGCKDYLEMNGHNLRQPFIYAHSLYRNREMLGLRKMLMAEQSPVSAVSIGDWKIRRLGTGEILVWSQGVGAYRATADGENIASTILHGLASQLLASSVGTPDQEGGAA